jgi:hypothetical protein
MEGCLDYVRCGGFLEKVSITLGAVNLHASFESRVANCHGELPFSEIDARFG